MIFFSPETGSPVAPGGPATHHVDQAGLSLRALPATTSWVLGSKGTMPSSYRDPDVIILCPLGSPHLSSLVTGSLKMNCYSLEFKLHSNFKIIASVPLIATRPSLIGSFLPKLSLAALYCKPQFILALKTFFLLCCIFLYCTKGPSERKLFYVISKQGLFNPY